MFKNKKPQSLRLGKDLRNKAVEQRQQSDSKQREKGGRGGGWGYSGSGGKGHRGARCAGLFLGLEVLADTCAMAWLAVAPLLRGSPCSLLSASSTSC